MEIPTATFNAILPFIGTKGIDEYFHPSRFLIRDAKDLYAVNRAIGFGLNVSQILDGWQHELEVDGTLLYNLFPCVPFSFEYDSIQMEPLPDSPTEEEWHRDFQDFTKFKELLNQAPVGGSSVTVNPRYLRHICDLALAVGVNRMKITIQGALDPVYFQLRDKGVALLMPIKENAPL